MSLRFGFTIQRILEEGRVNKAEIAHVMEWTLKQPSLPKLTNEQIAIFLVSCENELEATKKKIKAFYSIRRDHPRLFANRNVDRKELKKQAETINICALPEKTDDGRVIIFVGIQDTNYANLNLELHLVHFMMVMDSVTVDYPPTGCIVLIDMAGMGLMHITKLKMGVLKMFGQYLQECLPCRLDSIHILNTVYFVNKVVYLVRPFISKKLWDLVNFHDRRMDMEWFHKNCIPKKCLPTELGGDLPPIAVLHENTMAKLRETQAFFSAEESQRNNDL